jgi:hypothetical protein
MIIRTLNQLRHFMTYLFMASTQCHRHVNATANVMTDHLITTMQDGDDRGTIVFLYIKNLYVKK